MRGPAACCHLNGEGGEFPHPSSLRADTFSRKREKKGRALSFAIDHDREILSIPPM